MLKKGIVSATLKNLPYRDVVDISSSLGLKAIEWSENHHVPLDNPSLVRDMKNYTLDNGLEIASYGSYYRLGQNQNIIDHIRNACLIGARRVRIWAGVKASAEVSNDEYKALLKEAKEGARIAENEGVILCTEWHKNTLTDTNESGYRLLTDVNSPSFRTFWQPTQALSVKERNEGLCLVAPFVENIHVYYWNETGERRPLKEGVKLWKGYLGNLDASKNDYYALLEFVKDNTVEQLTEDAKAFREIIGD